jgi:hypothetical protein
MYETQWAAIVYGRSYHLDFRLIAIPQDFTQREINWAMPYILATTRKANKLTTYPRWSLFKNESHCIVGVTCMVRDLICQLEEDLIDLLAKDNRHRPLYVFVGYVAQLKSASYPLQLPPYTEHYLHGFQSLYDYVKQVWWIENYQKDSKKPMLTDYQAIEFDSFPATTNLLDRLNHQSKAPDKIFLWQHLPEQNQQLWLNCANCLQPTSIYLGAVNHQTAAKSPFLNATVEKLADFTTIDRVMGDRQRYSQSKLSRKRSLSELITQKARKDLAITRNYASKASHLPEQLIARLTQKFNNDSQDKQATNILPQENGFGLIDKSSNANPEKWF